MPNVEEPITHPKPDLTKGHKDSYSLMSTINCIEAKNGKGFNGGYVDSYPDIHLFDGKNKSIEKTFIDNFGSEGALRDVPEKKQLNFASIIEQNETAGAETDDREFEVG